MNNAKQKVPILDFDSMVELLAVVEEKIQYIGSSSATKDNALYQELCQKREGLRDALEEMFSENRELRDREKSLNHQQENEIR